MNDPSSARSLSLINFIKTFGVDQLPAWSELIAERAKHGKKQVLAFTRNPYQNRLEFGVTLEEIAAMNGSRLDEAKAAVETLVDDLCTPTPTPDSEPSSSVFARHDRSAIKATRKHQRARAAAKSARQARRRSRK